MRPTTTFPASVEPTLWNVVFHPTTATWWLDLLPIGRFKHVSAFAYVHGLRGWVLYDVQLGGTKIVVLPDLPASLDLIAKLTEGCDIIAMRRRAGGATGLRLGFWCVPAIKHLIGLRSGALRPDRLRRDCLRHGGQIINETAESRSADGPDAGNGSPAGAAGQGAGTAVAAAG